MFANVWITQNGKLQKEIDVQSKEIKDLCIAKGAIKEVAILKEQVKCVLMHLCLFVCLFANVEKERLMFADAWIAQNGKLQKDMDVQSKEMKEVYVLNGVLKVHLVNLLKDTDLQIKTVRKVGRD